MVHNSVAREWLCKTSAIFGLTKLRDMGLDKTRILFTKDPTGKFLSFAFMMGKEAPQQLKDFFDQR